MAVNDPGVPNEKRSLPMWVPLLGMLVAFGLTLLIGARICPVVSALALPPNPKLPIGNIKQLEHVQKGTGLDEFLYSTDQTGCQVALFYEDWLKDCVYDPDVSCGNGGPEKRFVTSDSYHVALCTGNQSIGIFNLKWTAYISSGYANGDKTFFRLIREVGN